MHLGSFEMQWQAVLKCNGTQLPRDTVDAMVRCGGWQVVAGAKTVLQTYARRVLDDFICPYSMSLGFGMSDRVRERRLEEYKGKLVFPEGPVADWGRNKSPLQVRVHAWRSQPWLAFQTQLNDVCAAIMSAALADEGIMPVRRYREVRGAFIMFVSRYANSDLVQEYKRLLRMRAHEWRTCLERAENACGHAFCEARLVVRPADYMTKRRFLAMLQDVHIGYVRLDGKVVKDECEWDSRWDVFGVCAWRRL
jgi:hypothetical protein